VTNKANTANFWGRRK